MAKQKVTFCVSALLLQASLNTSANAAGWEMDSTASLRAEYNDNRLLTTLPHEDVLGSLMDLKANMATETEFSETEFRPRITFERYRAAPDLDSNNQYLDMSTAYIGEYSRWTLIGNYTRDNTLNSQLDDTGPIQIQGFQTRRIKWHIDPQWTQELSDRSRFDLKMTNLSVSYEKAAELGLVDYAVKYIQAKFTYDHKESINSHVSMSAARLDAIGNQTDTFKFNIGIDYENQQTLVFGLQLGMQQVDYTQGFSTGPVVVGSESGFTINMNIVKDYEFTRWSLNLDRTVLPSGVGRSMLQEKIVVGHSYTLSRYIRSNISISALQNKEIQKNEKGLNRDYLNAAVSLNWSISPGWSLNSAYIYSMNNYEVRDGKATSNALQLTILYTDVNT